MKKKAFTLIELLVVIAIIAILAAILFPVFAQAKAAAKKTADLSNVKQLGTATAIYLNDSDDTYPLEAGTDPASGNFGYNYNKYVPAGWDATPTPAARFGYSETFVDNSIQPYVKSYAMFVIPGSTPGAEYKASDPIAAGQTKQATSYAYNGLLNGYSATAVAQPSQSPLWTALNGNTSGLGWGFANPALTCATAACTYGPPNPSCSGGSGSVYSTYGGAAYWANGQGQNWSLDDTHAKWRRMGATLAPGSTDYTTDPMTSYDATGHAGYYYTDPYGCYPYLFRPDFDFNNTTGL